MKRLLTALVVLLFSLFAAAAARADGIVVTETATTVTGSLDGSSFTNALVTLTLTGDTANVNQSLGSGIFELPGTATVFVAGIGSDTFTGSIFAIVNQSSTDGGISDLTQGPTEGAALIVTGNNLAFSTYDLTSSIGPLSGYAGSSLNFNNPSSTLGGSFVISNLSGDATFTATVVPEPSSLLLVIVGLAGSFGMWKRKKRTS